MTLLTLPDPLAAASVHAVDLQTGAEAGLEPDLLLPLASVVKLAWAVATHRSADAGDVSLRHRLTIDPSSATPGPTGISAWHDPVELSVRDAMHLSLAQSDNASADALLAYVGLDRVRARCAEIGLPDAVARHPVRALYDGLTELFGTPDIPRVVDLLARDPALLSRLPTLDATRANAASARDLTRLLGLIWADRACSPAGCASLRDSLLRPMAPGRIARGLASRDLRIANKTGSQLTLRHDVAWVGFPDGRSYAVAVLTRARRLGEEDSHDDAVGALARQAIQALRG
jgi:beta-lactamase class A